MSDEPATATPARLAPLDLAFIWFFRLLAACSLYLGILYWVRLIGIHGGSAWRFDLMPLHWQLASTCLAVLFPFAAVGLWLVAPWGPVIWFSCAAVETVMYGVYPQLFGYRFWVVGLHGLVLIVYLGFRVAFFLRRRRLSS